jgi:putative ABC transport system ATP-binding protein
MENIIIKTIGLTKQYLQGDTKVLALYDINIDIYSNDITAIIGQSGCGKSTLLHLLCGLDRPTKGTTIIENNDIYKFNETKRTNYRSENIGFVFQNFNLINELSVSENITLPAELSKRDYDKTYFNNIIEMLGLRDRLSFFPNQLSGGQQQRVAIARALIKKPKIILADEPTGNLDTKSGDDFVALMIEANKVFGQTFVIVTHNMDIAKKSNRIITLKDGSIVSDEREV